MMYAVSTRALFIWGTVIVAMLTNRDSKWSVGFGRS